MYVLSSTKSWRIFFKCHIAYIIHGTRAKRNGSQFYTWPLYPITFSYSIFLSVFHLKGKKKCQKEFLWMRWVQRDFNRVSVTVLYVIPLRSFRDSLRVIHTKRSCKSEKKKCLLMMIMNEKKNQKKSNWIRNT